MNNRLGDIPAWAMDDSDDDDVPNPASNGKGSDDFGGGDIEMQQQNQQPKFMENFFNEVDSIKKDIEAVSDATKKIGKINEEAISATTTDKENELSRQLRPLIDSTNKRARRTKTLLGLLKEETEKLQSEHKINASDLRYVTTTIIICTHTWHTATAAVAAEAAAEATRITITKRRAHDCLLECVLE